MLAANRVERELIGVKKCNSLDCAENRFPQRKIVLRAVCQSFFGCVQIVLRLPLYFDKQVERFSARKKAQQFPWDEGSQASYNQGCRQASSCCDSYRLSCVERSSSGCR